MLVGLGGGHGGSHGVGGLVLRCWTFLLVVLGGS